MIDVKEIKIGMEKKEEGKNKIKGVIMCLSKIRENGGTTVPVHRRESQFDTFRRV